MNYKYIKFNKTAKIVSGVRVLEMNIVGAEEHGTIQLIGGKYFLDGDSVGSKKTAAKIIYERYKKAEMRI